MSFRFETKKAVNILLFILQSLGGVADINRLFLLLYFADLRHLARHGTLISGDRYIAMRAGPAPFNIMGIFRQLKEDTGDFIAYARSRLSVRQQQVYASTAYDATYIAASEAESMFDIIQDTKNVNTLLLTAQFMDKAWNQANDNGEISIADMAHDSGATEEMIKYIETIYYDELYSFNNPQS